MPVMRNGTPQRLLALHGFQQDENVMRTKANALARGLEGIAVLHYLSGPHVEPKGRAWWRAERYREYEGLNESIDHVVAVCERVGPFDGVLGFSQGGTLASVLISHPGTYSLFRYAICMSAFPCRAVGVLDADWYGKVHKRSLHVWSTNDDLVRPSASEKLAVRFCDADRLVHNSGHRIPTDGNSISVVKDFVKSCSPLVSRM